MTGVETHISKLKMNVVIKFNILGIPTNVTYGNIERQQGKMRHIDLSLNSSHIRQCRHNKTTFTIMGIKDYSISDKFGYAVTTIYLFQQK